MKQALQPLVALLLTQLTKQEEGQDLDESVWNVSMAAGTCLSFVAQTVGDDVVALSMPYVQVLCLSLTGLLQDIDPTFKFLIAVNLTSACSRALHSIVTPSFYQAHWRVDTSRRQLLGMQIVTIFEYSTVFLRITCVGVDRAPLSGTLHSLYGLKML